MIRIYFGSGHFGSISGALKHFAAETTQVAAAMDIPQVPPKRYRLTCKQPRPRVKISASRVGPPLPLSCLRSIAGFSGNPPSIYSLSLSSRVFHVPQPDGPLLSTILLREALQSSLHRVLQFHHVVRRVIIEA